MLNVSSPWGAMKTRNASPDKNQRLKLSDAAKYLGVAPPTMSRLIKAGLLRCKVDPLDRRRKWVTVKDLDRLKQQSLND